jgi:Ca2+-binding RTX toxin-like protein
MVRALVVSMQNGVRTLTAGGTRSADTISIRRISTTEFGIRFGAGAESVFNYGSSMSPIQAVQVYGNEGNDAISVDPTLTIPAFIDGGAGDDTLRAGGGNDVLLGGDGKDAIYGNSGRDLIIGGAGRDTLYGMGDQDIIIGGRTIYDKDSAVLQSIVAYWNVAPTDSSYAWYQTRVATLRDVGIVSGVSVIKLNTDTTLDDNVADIIVGAFSMPAGTVRRPNWYLRNMVGAGPRDSLLSGVAGEISTDSGN